MTVGPGSRIGPYEVTALIGEGGMGRVWRAHHRGLKRDDALKVLPEAFLADPERLARFQREAQVLASLNHPHIAHVYGLEDADATRALVMELVEGPTLSDRIAGGPIPIHEALQIAKQIAEALDAAHEQGIIHRDLKPANIKVRDDGNVKVLDFGLAKAMEPTPGSPPSLSMAPTITTPAMTQAGVILGTAAYMSPEQARGHAIDKRTDIWAFGCVLYEMLTGRITFDRATVPDTIAAILEREPDWSALPSFTPMAVRRLLRRCLDKNRSQRLRDIADVRDALNDAEEDAPRIEAPASPDRAGWLRLLVVAALASGIVGVTVWLLSRGSAQTIAGEPSLGPRFSRVTADAAYFTEPALSPDGTLVVYASDRDGEGQLDLWLQRTSGGQPIRLTSDAADDRQPHFSPDGSLIAFRSDRSGGGVYVMPALGGNARLVAEGGRRPRFSPDGSRIAYWTGRWLAGAGARAPGNAVFTVPANGGQPVRVANEFWTARDPVWAPDGKSLLFVGRNTGEDSPAGTFDWWWAPLDLRAPILTGAYRLLADRGLSEYLEGEAVAARLEPVPAAWTRSGVLFSAGFGDSVSLWRLDVSPTTGGIIETSLERLTYGSGFDLLASVDDSGRIAFQASSEGYTSLTLSLDANAGRATGPVVRQTYWSGQAGGRNSLDDAGRLLAYVKSRTNESEIWVRELHTGQEQHLVTTPLTPLNPVISHDGAQVAYGVPDGPRVIGYVVSTKGGAPRQVCDGCMFNGWFSDNRRILALDRRESSRRIRVIDTVDRTEADLLTHPTAVVGRADVSPDGRWLSFSSQRGVWVVPARPGDPPQEREWVSVFKGAEDSAERACGWSPDGRLLYLLLERDGFRDLYAQRIDPARGTAVGEPFIVQHLHDPRRRWGSTPYGTAIVSNAFVFSQVETTGSIWLLDPGPGQPRDHAAP